MSPKCSECQAICLDIKIYFVQFYAFCWDSFQSQIESVAQQQYPVIHTRKEICSLTPSATNWWPPPGAGNRAVPTFQKLVCGIPMGLIDWPGENCKGEREANFIADEQIFATSNFIFRSPLSPSVLSFKNDLCQRQTRAASRRNETSDRAVPCIFLAPQPGKRTSLGFQSRFEKRICAM